ncbi:hypothetical protein IJT10_07145 [bacterium]|nr:hypothetical protein [bacterium]
MIMADTKANKAPEQNKEVFAQLRQLAEISRSIEQHTMMQSAATNIVQAGEIKRRIDELTEKQDRLVMTIVGNHPDPQVRENFRKLGKKIEDYRPKIKQCEDPEELRQLKKEVDEAVEEWIYNFQVIVSSILGVTPPDKAVQSDKPF